jgi:hypothetical protein
MDTKLCINCKHYALEGTSAAHLGKCMKTADECLVTGKQKQYDELSYCSTMRIMSICGPDAKLFEAK